MSAAARILDRLQRVRRSSAPGCYLALCPAHEDRNPSLSVRELEDGRLLLHCFAGCDTGAVLGALGLSLADLFERPLATAGKPTRQKIPLRDVLEAIDHQTYVVQIIASDMIAAGKATEEQLAELNAAASRIHAARDYVNGS